MQVCHCQFVSATVQHGLSDHGFSDNTGHPTFLLSPAKILSLSCILPRFIRHFTTDYPTTRVNRHFFAGPKRNFTTDYPTFFVTTRISQEKINICVRAMYSMTNRDYMCGAFRFVLCLFKVMQKKCFLREKNVSLYVILKNV